MHILDSRFKRHKARYAFQCLLATIGALVVVLVIEPVKHAATVAALGSTVFVIFAVPHRRQSRPRRVVGGYAVGILAGALCFWLSQWIPAGEDPALAGKITAVFAALAVGLAVFGMVITNTEHAPAAGMALGLVLHEWNEWTLPGVAMVFLGVLCLAGIHRVMKPILIDLL